MNRPALHRLYNTSHPGSCAPDTAFVTLIANETYVPGALCLRRSLVRARSACPIVLVVADPLPSEAMAALSTEYGSSNIYRLSDLRRRLELFQQKVAARRLQEQKPVEQPLRNTRQLRRAGGWARRTHQKLLLFALSGYRRMAFLDIDMLVARNVDAILDQPAFSAVAALPYSMTSFNSGVFVFEPSLPTAAALDDLSRRATFRPARATAGKNARTAGGPIRVRGAGERFELTDQSILNHHYLKQWRPLPFGYNMGVKTRQVSPKLWNKVELAVIHFVHRPKPWEATLADANSPMAQLTRRLGIEPLTHAWRYHCLGVPLGNVTLTAADQFLFSVPGP